MINNLILDFKNIFKSDKSVQTFFTSGRVNLIGEHVDYNGEKVFPSTLNFGTFAIVQKREDSIFRMYSNNFPEKGIISSDLNFLINDPTHNWANYPKGVIKTFLDNSLNISSGFGVLFYGNIPNGADLSSSASIEILTGTILKDLFNLDISMIEIVKLSQIAENKFIGVNCGIMDQFSIGMGKNEHAILLDCNTLDYKYVPFSLNGASIVISNTNKKRGLSDSKYNERRAECENALKALNDNGVNISALYDLDLHSFVEIKHFITSPNELARAVHVISENDRVYAAVKALENNDLDFFGKLMNASHLSLKNSYEVTGFEFDSLVEAAWEEEGVIGSRMTGAGFGGCTVSIVKNEFIDSFIKNVGDKYFSKTGLKADFYIATPGDGAKKLGEY